MVEEYSLSSIRIIAFTTVPAEAQEKLEQVLKDTLGTASLQSDEYTHEDRPLLESNRVRYSFSELVTLSSLIQTQLVSDIVAAGSDFSELKSHDLSIRVVTYGLDLPQINIVTLEVNDVPKEFLGLDEQSEKRRQTLAAFLTALLDKLVSTGHSTSKTASSITGLALICSETSFELITRQLESISAVQSSDLGDSLHPDFPIEKMVSGNVLTLTDQFLRKTHPIQDLQLGKAGARLSAFSSNMQVMLVEEIEQSLASFGAQKLKVIALSKQPISFVIEVNIFKLKSVLPIGALSIFTATGEPYPWSILGELVYCSSLKRWLKEFEHVGRDINSQISDVSSLITRASTDQMAKRENKLEIWQEVRSVEDRIHSLLWSAKLVKTNLPRSLGLPRRRRPINKMTLTVTETKGVQNTSVIVVLGGEIPLPTSEEVYWESRFQTGGLGIGVIVHMWTQIGEGLDTALYSFDQLEAEIGDISRSLSNALTMQSNEAVEKLSTRTMWLTAAIVVLTVVLIGLTIIFK